MKLIPVFNENVCQMVSCEEIKARKHPGKCCNIAKPLPDNLIHAIIKSLKGWNTYLFKYIFFIHNSLFVLYIYLLYIVVDAQLKSVLSNGQLLVNYLRSRHTPIENSQKMEKKQQYKVELEKKCMYLVPTNINID